MTVAELIQPGDKVDITFFQHVANLQSEDKPTRVYKSQVLDMKDNGNIVLSMPSEGAKLVLLPLGVRLEFVFYTRGGLYRSLGQIKERFKSDNIYMLEIEIKTQPEKFQRREFFRFPYVLDFVFFDITEEEAQFPSAEALLIHLRDIKEFSKREKSGSIVDLSGGGIRFRSDVELEPNSNALFEIHLQNENINKQYYIIGRIISCVKAKNKNGSKYELRAKFKITDNTIREEIVRFIFEEERKSRQRGRW